MRFVLAGGAFVCAAAPASADVGAAVSIFTDARFRGYSISDGYPAAFLDLSYDDPGGVYAAASGSLVASPDGLHPLALQLNGGYAKRLSPLYTLDLGVVHTEYSRYSTSGPGRSSTELYAGIARKSLAGRLYFSPHYFETGKATLYGELEDSLGLPARLRLKGHAGLLVPLASRAGDDGSPRFDWRLGLTRQFGPISLSAAWTGRTRVGRYDGAAVHGGDALVLGASWAL